MFFQALLHIIALKRVKWRKKIIMENSVIKHLPFRKTFRETFQKKILIDSSILSFDTRRKLVIQWYSGSFEKILISFINVKIV